MTTLNPIGVEASMRLQYSTLDHLPIEVFRQEAALARAAEVEQPGYLRAVADAFGMLGAFDAWEAARRPLCALDAARIGGGL